MAPILGPGPVPYPVFMGSDPGVSSFFQSLGCDGYIDANLYILDGSSPFVSSHGVVSIPLPRR